MINLFGGGGAAGPSVRAFETYQSYRNVQDERRETFGESPQVQREIEYFNKAIEEMESPEDLYADRRAMAYVLSAYGMDGELDLMGRMKKVLSEDPSDPNALANKLLDPRFKEIAEGLQISDRGLGRLQLGVFQDELAEKYKTNEYEKSLGEQNPALRQAEYFKRKIEGITDTFQILGDKILRDVVTTALGLPTEIVFQSIDKQKELVENGFKVGDMADPKKLEGFIQRYLIQADLKTQQSGGFGGGGAGGWQTQLLGGVGGVGGIGVNLLI